MNGFATLVAYGGVVVAGLVGRKADKFAALLDGTDPSAAADPSMSQLTQIAQRLSNVPQPTAAFRSSLRDQLMATAAQTAPPVAPHAPAAQTPTHAATQAPPAHTPAVPSMRVDPTHALSSGAGSGTSSATTAAGAAGTGGVGSSVTSGLMTLGKSAPLWAKLFAGVAAVSVSATGVAVGAQRALPGDFFYGVKKQVEAIQLDLASGARGKATAQLNFARTRLHELDKLLKRDHVVPGQPVSKETASRINGLLEAWAEDAGVGTTSLIQQIRALGSSPANAAKSVELRNELSTFTSSQFGTIGQLLGDMPDSSLQSLTVSALGYLQRVDRALGHDPGTLISRLPVTLNAVPGVSKVLPRLVLPSSVPLKNGQAVLPNPAGVVSSAVGAVQNVPGAVQSLLPSGLLPSGLLPSGLLPTSAPGVTLPSLGAGSIALPSAGSVSLPVIGALQSALPSVGALVPGVSSILPLQPGVISLVPSTAPVAENPSSSTAPAPANPLPSAVQSAVGAVQSAPGAVVSQLPGAVKSAVGGLQSGSVSVPTALPSAVQSAVGAVTNPVQSAAGDVAGAVTTVVTGGVSSAGPSLPLPATIPVLPALPKIPGLPALK